MAKTQTLQAQGWRFVFRAGESRWSHPLEVQADDMDVSDMSDDEFEQFVREHSEVTA